MPDPPAIESITDGARADTLIRTAPREVRRSVASKRCWRPRRRPACLAGTFTLTKRGLPRGSPELGWILSILPSRRRSISVGFTLSSDPVAQTAARTAGLSVCRASGLSSTERRLSFSAARYCRSRNLRGGVSHDLARLAQLERWGEKPTLYRPSARRAQKRWLRLGAHVSSAEIRRAQTRAPSRTSTCSMRAPTGFSPSPCDSPFLYASA